MDIGLAMTARVLPSRPRPLPDVYRQVIDEAAPRVTRPIA
jgi:hypothetical protein